MNKNIYSSILEKAFRIYWISLVDRIGYDEICFNCETISTINIEILNELRPKEFYSFNDIFFSQYQN